MEFVVILWIICNLGCIEIECIFTPVVEISQGKLRGLRSVSGQNKYYGIPYAVSDRFQAPREPPPWEGIFTAADRLGHCAQRVWLASVGTEQCLQLDLYTPEGAPPARLRPVLLFIHGGGYYYGTKGHYDPEFLVAKNVVVVIINYRVGALGFLCAHGVANLGLKDQVAALQWVRKNIAAFGGDPDNVTISGQSAGASAAAMHILSEYSKGLFHKLILMSGTPLTPWAFNVEPLKPAFEDAGRLGKVANEADVYNVFANASLFDLLSACRDVSTSTRYFKYSPCVDANSTTEPFFRDTPFNIIKSGRFNKVPMIVGYAEEEGILFYGLHDDQTLKEWNDNFVERLPSVFSWLPEKQRQEIARKLRAQYFGNKRIDKRAVRGIVDYYSDWLAYASADGFTALMSEHSDQPVYNYIFSYEGERNFAKFVFGQRAGLKGATHSDDLFYVFKPAGLSLVLSQSDRLFIDRLTTMFTNFMKFGEPTPAVAPSPLLPVPWPAAAPRSGNESRVLRLGRALSAGRARTARAGTQAMRTLLCAHGRPGYVPCEPP